MTAVLSMPTFAGTAKVVRFNWPKYAAVGAVLFAALVMAVTGGPRPVQAGLRIIGVLGCAWTISSLIATWWVYDHRHIYDQLTCDFGDLGDWASVHAGFDDATPALTTSIGQPPTRVAEISMQASASLRRARRNDQTRSTGGSCDALPFASASLDTVFVTFAVHEVRDRHDQQALFAELRRALRPGGRLVVTEHLRDPANLAVYGPGAFHFQSSGVWRDRATEAGLTRLSDTSITPFVHRLTWQR